MIAESAIHTALSPLVTGRVFPDVAPEGAALPRIVYQQVGGQSVSYLDNALADKENGRIQVSCWANTRLAAIELSQLAEAAVASLLTVQASPIGARVSIYEDDTRLYGCRIDFDVWSQR